MMKEPYQEALDAFANPSYEYSVEPFNSGLINRTYKITNKQTGNSFVLQQINSRIFSEPAQLQHNYEKLWSHLQNEEIMFIMPEPRYFPGTSPLYYDSDKNYWRVFEFMHGAVTYDTAQDVEQAGRVARVFGYFTACFRDFNAKELYTTIPGFHHLPSRYTQFTESLHTKNYQRLLKAAPIADALKKRERYASLYEVLTSSDAFPQRVIHHDAKISNVLFDQKSGEVICPVDFDTTMPGFFFSDLGDMIRSMACCKDENSTELTDLCIRPDYYEAIVDGYLSVMQDQLTDAEKKYVHFSGLMIIYMQSLRFLTDYLSGDRYYRTDYKEQNFDRANNQLVLLENLEKFLRDRYQFSV